MYSSSLHRSHVVLIVLLILGIPANAAVHRCLGPEGLDLYTDTPTPGQACALLLEKPTATIAPKFPADAIQEVRTLLVPGTVIVPVQRMGQLLVVTATINGSRSVRLIVDTGASHTILSEAVARDLGYRRDGGAKVTFKTAGGLIQARMVTADSIQLADARLVDIPVAIHDVSDAPSGIDGLLGMTFLDHFTIALDLDRSQLQLQRRL